MGEKTVYSKPGIVFFDFKANEIRGTTELRKEYLQKWSRFLTKPILRKKAVVSLREEICCILGQPTLEIIQPNKLQSSV